MEKETIYNPTRIFLWCVPRSASTVFTKFMSFVDGAEIWNEPYCLSWVNKYFVKEEIEQHDIMKVAMEKILSSVSPAERGNLRPMATFTFASTKESLERNDSSSSRKKFIFIKDMAWAIDGHYEYIPSKVPCKHVFLIRHPHRFLMSHRAHMMRSFGISADEDYKHGINDPLCHAGDKTRDHIFELWNYVRKNMDPNPIVMDSDDFLRRPESILPKLFADLGIPWKESYLQWSESDDVIKTWFAGLEHVIFGKERGAFSRAFASDHFITVDKPIPERDELHPEISKYIDYFMPGYNEMYKHILQ